MPENLVYKVELKVSRDPDTNFEVCEGCLRPKEVLEAKASPMSFGEEI